MPKPGKENIAHAFEAARGSKTAALMPYFTLGYPDLDTSLEIIRQIAPLADLIELGIPFSDPIADGPTIQHSTQVALESGTTTASCLTMVQSLRDFGLKIPLLLMGYYNPILAYGEKRFVQDATDAGVDGFIIPDLPFEEADDISQYARTCGLNLIHFMAPTTNPERAKVIVQKAEGFVYLVSVTGVTGTIQSLNLGLADQVRQIKDQTKIPVAVGFGISTPSQAASVAQFADGVIIGSALINAVEVASDKVQASTTYLTNIHDALLIDPAIQ